MKPIQKYKSAVLVVALMICSNWAHAARPSQPKEDLASAASHIVQGDILNTYSYSEKKEGFEYTYYIVEVAVKQVMKGKDITVHQRMYAHYWSKKWLDDTEPAAPGDYGHVNVPDKGDIAEIYVRGNDQSGFDVLMPNGFFKITKPKNASK